MNLAQLRHPPQPREGWTKGREDGCTYEDAAGHRCATQLTETVCGCCGRRCAEHDGHRAEPEENECPA